MKTHAVGDRAPTVALDEIVRLEARFDLATAERTNLLEVTKETLTPEGRGVSFDIKPFKIVTLKLTPR